jgi:hypothetical protein
MTIKREIFEIAETLGYRKLERLRAIEDKISDQVLLDILKTCIVETYAILFFQGKCFQITPFGAKFALTYSKEGSIENYLLAFPELDEKFLRNAFTGFELVVFKLCHIALESQQADYHWETETTRQRIKRLAPSLSLPDTKEYLRLFDEIFFVRDAFAHTFLPVNEIKYKEVPLSECFGETFVGLSKSDAKAFGASIFTDDLSKIFEPVMNLFKQYQLKQIDSTKFQKLCDRLLASRSLSP